MNELARKRLDAQAQRELLDFKNTIRHGGAHIVPDSKAGDFGTCGKCGINFEAPRNRYSVCPNCGTINHE